MDGSSSAVVVGVDGNGPGLAAVRYAATEARRDGGVLHLVHVAPHGRAMAPMSPLVTAGRIHDVAERALAEARHVAQEVAGPDVPIEAELRTGGRSHLLVRAGEGAATMVLGRKERVGLSGLITGSVVTHVATRAHCPVVSVPETWRASSDPGRVVAGVDDPEQSTELLAAAFQAAERRSADLVVVHAWHLPGPYDDLVIDAMSDQVWHDQAVEDMEKAMAPFRATHPSVPVELDVRHQHPASSLMGAGEGAALLLVGRRGHGAPFGFHLGGVARVLLTRAHGPVEVVPLHPRHHETAEVPALT